MNLAYFSAFVAERGDVGRAGEEADEETAAACVEVDEDEEVEEGVEVRGSRRCGWLR